MWCKAATHDLPCDTSAEVAAVDCLARSDPRAPFGLHASIHFLESRWMEEHFSKATVLWVLVQKLLRKQMSSYGARYREDGQPLLSMHVYQHKA